MAKQQKSRAINTRQISRLQNKKSFFGSKRSLLVVAVFAVVGVAFIISSFALSNSIYTSSIVAEAIDHNPDDALTDPNTTVPDTEHAHVKLVGRLYESGELLCPLNTVSQTTELQKYKVVSIPGQNKKNLENDVTSTELSESDEPSVENVRTEAPSRVLVYKKDKVVVQNTDAVRKNTKSKQKAEKVHNDFRNNCKKKGTEFIPVDANFVIKKSDTASTNAVIWPESLPALKTSAQIEALNIDNLRSKLGITNKTNKEIKQYLLSQSVSDQSTLLTYSDKTSSADQTKVLYDLAGSLGKTTFNVVQNGVNYTINVSFVIPTPAPDKSNLSKIVDTVTKKVTPKAEAATAFRSVRIKVLITDETRTVYRPQLTFYRSIGQMMQLYFPTQQQERRNINVTDVSYLETPVGQKLGDFCNSVTSCDLRVALDRLKTYPGVNVANTYTIVYIPGATVPNACGMAYVPGTVSVVASNVINGCGPQSVNSRAATGAHELMHNIGFGHDVPDPGNTLLGANSSCIHSTYNIFSCKLSDVNRWYINIESLRSNPFRAKAIPGYNCPIIYGVVYPEVGRGSTGDCVRMLQWRLTNFNNGSKASVSINGVYDAATENAVRFLQGAAGLPVTGKVDTNTWIMINVIST